MKESMQEKNRERLKKELGNLKPISTGQKKDPKPKKKRNGSRKKKELKE